LPRCSTVKPVLLPALLALLAAGCPPPRPQPPPDTSEPAMEPLALQQARLYPETVTKRFVSLVDFEDAPNGPRGFKQADLFTIEPAAPQGRVRFVVHITRTGAGALEVLLPAQAGLVMKIPHIHDFSGYTLLGLAVHSEALRDDLRVELTTDNASWRSPRTLVQPGWTHVLIDIRRLQREPGFDIRGVRTLRLSFGEAAEPVAFGLDDVILIDNARDLTPVPSGFWLRKEGLDYRLRLPGDSREVAIRQGDDALWREGFFRPVVGVCGPGRMPATAGESLERMGARRIGSLEILEHNRVRVRLRNTWYFPTRGGEWLSMSVRRLAIEHTFWADGRCATCVELNNAGGPEIAAVRLRAPRRAAWAVHDRRQELLLSPFHGPVGLWQYLLAPAIPEAAAMESNYMRPPPVRISLGRQDAYAPGDADRDGFDESQGCYFLAAAPGGHCRFSVRPPPEGLVNPAFRIQGPWGVDVSVQTAGRAVRDVGRADDGAVVFMLEGRFYEELPVEVTGPPAEPPPG
jgi:hypothetical protein